MVSGLGLNTTLLSSKLLFSPPSSRYVTESVRPPAMLKVPAAEESPFVSVTPGCSFARSNTFLPFSGAR